MYCTRNVTEDIVWVGGNDRRLSLFEGVYKVPYGVSYNSYLLLDEKTVLLDTVDKAVGGIFFENIEHTLNGRPLDYLIVNHMEPDHCAMIEDLTRRHPETVIVTNAKVAGMIKQFFNFDVDSKLKLVSEGDDLSTGKHNLTFIMAPMVHWPEVMVEYEISEKVLFSADAFGKFGALGTDEDWTCEARRYYFNIVGKYGIPVQTLLKKAATLDIKTICPLHGPILNENLDYYIGKYMTWSSYEPEDDGVLVACASIHGNTKYVAEKMYEILKTKGAKKVAFTDLTRDDMAEAIEDAFRYSRLVLAAASYDGGVFHPMEDFLNRLSHKAYQKRTVALIENASWAPSANRSMRNILDTMKNISICENTVTIMSTMKDSDIIALEKLADEILSR